MLYNLLFILAILSIVLPADAHLAPTSNEDQIAQGIERYPPNLNAYLRALREKILTLQQNNQELRGQIMALQFYCQRADVLQQRLNDLDKEFSDVDNQNQSLNEQIKQDKEQLEAFVKERVKNLADLQQCHTQLAQAQAQSTLNEREQQLNSQKKIEQQQQNSKELTWLNEQIQIKNKKIRDLNSQIGDLNKQIYELNISKNISEQQLQDKTKRLEVLEKTNLQSLNETKETETALKSTIEEKTASITKWREDYSLLQSQLNKAVSINSELRKQITQLEEECKKR